MKKTKPFPWKCGKCGKKAVNPAAVPYTMVWASPHGDTTEHFEAADVWLRGVCGYALMATDFFEAACEKTLRLAGIWRDGMAFQRSGE